MITINTYSLSSDMKTITLNITAASGAIFTTLHVYVNSGYLTKDLSTNPVTYIDLSSKLLGTETEDITITATDLLFSDVETIRGIITFYAVSDNTDTATQALVNLYYIQLVLANMIINKEVQSSYHEVATVYFLLKAIDIYINLDKTAQKVEQATNAYERVVAMVERNPVYLLDKDTNISAGSGSWIINGTYIIN